MRLAIMVAPLSAAVIAILALALFLHEDEGPPGLPAELPEPSSNTEVVALPASVSAPRLQVSTVPPVAVPLDTEPAELTRSDIASMTREEVGQMLMALEGNEELSEEQKMVRMGIIKLDLARNRISVGSKLTKPNRIGSLLSQSLAVIQYEFGEYRRHGPSHPIDEYGVPLQFIINGIAYNFADGTYPEWDEISAMTWDPSLLVNGQIPHDLEEMTFARYTEARAYLEARVEL